MLEREHVMSFTSMQTPNFSFVNSTAAIIARYESRLQQRGPPTEPIFAREAEVIRFDKPHASVASGVDFVIIDM